MRNRGATIQRIRHEHAAVVVFGAHRDRQRLSRRTVGVGQPQAAKADACRGTDFSAGASRSGASGGIRLHVQAFQHRIVRVGKGDPQLQVVIWPVRRRQAHESARRGADAVNTGQPGRAPQPVQPVQQLGAAIRRDQRNRALRQIVAGRRFVIQRRVACEVLRLYFILNRHGRLIHISEISRHASWRHGTAGQREMIRHKTPDTGFRRSDGALREARIGGIDDGELGILQLDFERADFVVTGGCSDDRATAAGKANAAQGAGGATVRQHMVGDNHAGPALVIAGNHRRAGGVVSGGSDRERASRLVHRSASCGNIVQRAARSRRFPASVGHRHAQGSRANRKMIGRTGNHRAAASRRVSHSHQHIWPGIAFGEARIHASGIRGCKDSAACGGDPGATGASGRPAAIDQLQRNSSLEIGLDRRGRPIGQRHHGQIERLPGNLGLDDACDRSRSGAGFKCIEPGWRCSGRRAGKHARHRLLGQNVAAAGGRSSLPVQFRYRIALIFKHRVVDLDLLACGVTLRADSPFGGGMQHPVVQYLSAVKPQPLAIVRGRVKSVKAGCRDGHRSAPARLKLVRHTTRAPGSVVIAPVKINRRIEARQPGRACRAVGGRGCSGPGVIFADKPAGIQVDGLG